MMLQLSLGVRLFGVLLMEIQNVGREELVFKKKNNEFGFKYIEFFVFMGYLGRVFYALERYNILVGVLVIVGCVWYCRIDCVVFQFMYQKLDFRN